MKIILHRWLLLFSLSITLAEDYLDLPLCPTNLQFFPQKLPMHCRMPRSIDPESYPGMPQFPTLPPLPESYFQSPSPDKQPPPIPIPIPPFPGMPGAMPMPGAMGGPMPGMPGVPGAMPMPMPMVGGPSHKLPVIVMPFYSQDHSFKKPPTKKPPHIHNHDDDKKKRKKKRPPHKKKKHSDSETDSSCEDTSESDNDDTNSSDEHGFWKGRRKARRKISRRFNREHKMRRKESKNKKKNLLTPILQYVTKDGYVIFEKKISKNEAQDWLKPQNERPEVAEKKHKVKPEQKPQEDFLFNPKSAEEFFKLDEEEKRRKSMELKEVAAAEAQAEVVPRKEKKQHRPSKFNPLKIKNNK